MCFFTRTGERLRAAVMRKLSPAPTISRGAGSRAFALQALAALCLILAAAGLHYRHATRKIQVVVAADVSPSIYELSAQTARIRELLGALDPASTDIAVVVFSETAGLERSMFPLPPPLTAASPEFQKPGGSRASLKTLPDLLHLNAVLKTNGTDIGGALQFARGAFTSPDCSRAILLLSDFRDTRTLNNRSAAKSAAFLRDSGIDLLATPAILGPSCDVQLAEFRVPEIASTGRAVPLEITIASQQPTTVVVSVRRRALGKPSVFVDSKTVRLDATKNCSGPSGELRKTVRLFDHPTSPGVAIYTARITGPDGAAIPGDVNLDNNLSAAVPVAGPSKWAVLARRNSTLSSLATDPAKPLGVETRLFFTDQLPSDAAAYEAFAGILVDGLSSTELPDSGTALHALGQAVEQGKALVTVGGETAFGAGGHPRDGAWERVLPVEMTPEDDRARAVLFVIDVSKSMDDKILHGGRQVRKMDYAAEQLQIVSKLRPQDRLGMIEFSGDAKLAAPLTNEPTHSAFLNAVHDIRIGNKTDFVPALELAKNTLDADDAEEQIVILISDGVDTVRTPPEVLRAAEKLCPKPKDGAKRRTMLWTFGIGVGKDDVNTTGEALLKDLATTGGGNYFSDFLELGKGIKEAVGQGEKDFYTRRESFVPRPGQPHALTQNGGAWPVLNFRNRVKARSGADTILSSGAPSAEAAGAKKQHIDPLVVLSGPSASGLARRAALAFTLDGDEGAKLLAPGSAGRTLVANVLSWAEARGEHSANGVSIVVEPFGNDELSVELRAFDPQTGEPENILNPSAILTVLQNAETETGGGDAKLPPLALRAVAPGTYRGTMRAPPAAVCRLSVRDAGRTIAERFVSTPCAAEMRRFGVDRAAMAELLAQAGPNARAIESPRDLAQWAAEKTGASGLYDLRGWLLALALGLLFVEYGLRGKRG